MSEPKTQPACDMEPALLRRFADGEANRSDRRRVMNHLFTGCTGCKGELRGRFQLLNEGENAPPSMSRVLANVADVVRRLDQERGIASGLWQDFQKHPPARQWTLLKNSSRFDSWPFCELLLNSGFEALYDDPHRALELNQMALLIAERLPPNAYSERTHFDSLACVWGRIANANRAISDLSAAESALARAEQFLERGSGEPLAEGEHWYFKASILRARRRLPEARAAIRRSRRVYRLVDELHLEGRSLLCEAAINDLEGDLAKAAACTRKALAQIDPQRDPKLALAVRHNLIWYLMCIGSADEARRELEDLRPLYFKAGDRMNLLRLRWMEGRIHRLLGDAESAEIALRDSHVGFVEASIPYEAASVGLDLAIVLHERGRVQELKPLASGIANVFRNLGVDREAIAAIAVFESAAAAEIVSLALIGRLSQYLAKVRSEPGSPFDPEN